VNRLVFVSLLVPAVLAACHPSAVVRAPNSTTTAVAKRVELCADFRLLTTGPSCIRPLTAEEQSHRSQSFRVEYEGSRASRLERINGRGGPEPDDDNCTQYSYRYEGGEVVELIGHSLGGSVCARALFSDHATHRRAVDEFGRPSFENDSFIAERRYERDARGFLMSSRVFGADGSPITPFGGAHEVRYERDARGFERKGCFFDETGKPYENAFHTHCYTYQYDDFGNDIDRRSWDSKNQPTTEGGGSAHLVREVDRYGNVTSTHSTRLDGTGISSFRPYCATVVNHFDEFGFRIGWECLDGRNQPWHFREGLAIGRSTPDMRGHTREVRYFDGQGRPFDADPGFARYELSRDERGRVIERRWFRANGMPGQKDGPAVERYTFDERDLEVKRAYFDASDKPSSYRGCVEVDSEYDSFRQRIRRTCLDAAGKPTRAKSGVAINRYTYDTRGYLLEDASFDEREQPANDEGGIARSVYHHDSLGLFHGTDFFAADGSKVSVPRFSSLIVRLPYSSESWPEGNREEALARIEAARRDLLAGLPFVSALKLYGDVPINSSRPGDIGYQPPARFYSSIRVVTESLKVGEYSEITEFPFGFAIYQRTE